MLANQFTTYNIRALNKPFGTKYNSTGKYIAANRSETNHLKMLMSCMSLMLHLDTINQGHVASFHKDTNY